MLSTKISNLKLGTRKCIRIYRLRSINTNRFRSFCSLCFRIRWDPSLDTTAISDVASFYVFSRETCLLIFTVIEKGLKCRGKCRTWQSWVRVRGADWASRIAFEVILKVKKTFLEPKLKNTRLLQPKPDMTHKLESTITSKIGWIFGSFLGQNFWYVVWRNNWRRSLAIQNITIHIHGQ